MLKKPFYSHEPTRAINDIRFPCRADFSLRRLFQHPARLFEVNLCMQRESAIAGLCATCGHMRRVTSDRGSQFYFCELSKVDTRFPKYPRLPVLECAGYRYATEPGGAEEDLLANDA
jgi:hypothetical protein